MTTFLIFDASNYLPEVPNCSLTLLLFGRLHPLEPVILHLDEFTNCEFCCICSRFLRWELYYKFKNNFSRQLHDIPKTGLNTISCHYQVREGTLFLKIIVFVQKKTFFGCLIQFFKNFVNIVEIKRLKILPALLCSNLTGRKYLSENRAKLN